LCKKSDKNTTESKSKKPKKPKKPKKEKALKQSTNPTQKKTNTHTGSEPLSQPNPLVGGTSHVEEKTKGKAKKRYSKKPKKSSVVGGAGGGVAAAAAAEIALSPMTSTSVTATVNKPSAPATPASVSNPLGEVVVETHVDQATGKKYSYNAVTNETKWLE
jgi:hypothetical protein